MHLYQPTFANMAFPFSTFSVEEQFTSFEDWYRCMHNGRMVQLIIEGNIQSLTLLWTKADKTSESDVLHVLDLFHPVASDIIDEADHHATHCRESYLEKCHYYVMAPHLPNLFSAIVNQVMVKETAHWR